MEVHAHRGGARKRNWRGTAECGSISKSDSVAEVIIWLRVFGVAFPLMEIVSPLSMLVVACRTLNLHGLRSKAGPTRKRFLCVALRCVTVHQVIISIFAGVFYVEKLDC